MISIDSDEINKKIISIQAQISPYPRMTKVIILGCTGSGKSSLSCCLSKNDVIVKQRSKNKIFLEGNGIGSGGTSYTKEPIIYIDKDSKIIYCDCPGFEDTDGDNQEIINSILIDSLFQISPNSKFKILLIFSSYDIDSGRGNGIVKILERMSKMFPNPDQLKNGIGLVITMGEPDCTGIDYLEQLKENSPLILNNWCDFFIKRPDHVFIFPMAQKNDIGKKYKFEDLKRIQNFIQINQIIDPLHSIAFSENTTLKIQNLKNHQAQKAKNNISDIFINIHNVYFKNQKSLKKLNLWSNLFSNIISRQLFQITDLKNFLDANIKNIDSNNVYFDEFEKDKSINSFLDKIFNDSYIKNCIRNEIEASTIKCFNEVTQLYTICLSNEEHDQKMKEFQKREEKYKQKEKEHQKLKEKNKRKIEDAESKLQSFQQNSNYTTNYSSSNTPDYFPSYNTNYYSSRHEIVSMDDDIAVVIDNGSYTTKVGLGADECPTSVFPTVTGRSKYIMPIKNSKINDTYVGIEALKRAGCLNLKNPIKNGIIENWDDIEKLWEYIFTNELRINSNEHRVLITDSPFNPLYGREKTIQIFMEKFQSPLFYIADTSKLSLLSSGRVTGITLESGHDISNFAPYYEGYAIPHAAKQLNLAGKKLTLYLRSLLESIGYSFPTEAELEIVRDIKEKYGYLADDFVKEITKSQNSKKIDISYELPDKTSIEIGKERFYFAELLYKPSMNSIECEGYGETLYNSIIECDAEIRKQLFNNIVLSGGTTMLEGFGNRIKNDLSLRVPYSTNVDVIANPERKYSAWIGGSIFSCLTTFEDMSISQYEYYENGPGIVHRKCFN